MTIHDRIREARLKANLSLSALAKRIGVTTTCVWNWDRENTRPRETQLEKLAEALNTSVEWLRDGVAKAPLEEPAANPSSLDEVLEDARSKIASLLSIDVSRIQLNLEVAT